MLSFLDVSLIVLFFVIGGFIAYIPAMKKKGAALDYMLAGRGVTLPVFVMVNVASWYGGILGVGEFTYRYGIINWFTQGLPYYIFAFLFAVFLVKKIKSKDLLTIPDAIALRYGKIPALLAAILIYLLTSPAPYVLMTAIIISHIFALSAGLSILLVCLFTVSYLWFGGFRSDIVVNVYFFILMFVAFAVVVVLLYSQFGGLSFFQAHLPPEHLQIPGNASFAYIIVWWLIAIWTFADPGFYQRVQSARSASVAKTGVLISILLWFLFDLFSNSLGLYARSLLPGLADPAQSYLFLADKYIGPGVRGLFYAGLFATILATLNSFFFLSATTFANDLYYKTKDILLRGPETESPQMSTNIVSHTRIGLLVTACISGLISYFIPSVINIWYVLGSVCIPGIIFVLLSVYYPKFSISSGYITLEITLSFIGGTGWWILRNYNMIQGWLNEIEPMITGLLIGLIIHTIGYLYKTVTQKNNIP
ncbi:MAG: hypothetical protein LWX56_15030 [Ignavibacteria bacterium]|nr:hypothetical protein [Ignavibacteria bacterium]